MRLTAIRVPLPLSPAKSRAEIWGDKSLIVLGLINRLRCYYPLLEGEMCCRSAAKWHARSLLSRFFLALFFFPLIIFGVCCHGIARYCDPHYDLWLRSSPVKIPLNEAKQTMIEGLCSDLAARDNFFLKFRATDAAQTPSFSEPLEEQVAKKFLAVLSSGQTAAIDYIGDLGLLSSLRIAAILSLRGVVNIAVRSIQRHRSSLTDQKFEFINLFADAGTCLLIDRREHFPPSDSVLVARSTLADAAFFIALAQANPKNLFLAVETPVEAFFFAKSSIERIWGPPSSVLLAEAFYRCCQSVTHSFPRQKIGLWVRFDSVETVNKLVDILFILNKIVLIYAHLITILAHPDFDMVGKILHPNVVIPILSRERGPIEHLQSVLQWQQVVAIDFLSYPGDDLGFFPRPAPWLPPHLTITRYGNRTVGIKEGGAAIEEFFSSGY